MNASITRRHRIPAIALAILLVAAFAFPSCSLLDFTPDNAYKTMTVNNYIAEFSFEYRAFYRRVEGPTIVDYGPHRFTYVFVEPPSKRRPVTNIMPGSKGEVVQMSYGLAVIEVNAGDASKNPDLPAHVRVEGALRSWSRWSQFKLLERATTTVEGVPAEYIVYEIDPPFPGWPLEYHAEAYFDREGLQWWVKASTDVELAEAVRADFDHVLQTLKILE